MFLYKSNNTAFATSLGRRVTIIQPCSSAFTRVVAVETSSLIIPCVQLVEIPTWFRLLYKNFGCAEPLLSWLQREKRVLVSSILQYARSWPSTAARTGHGTQAHTQKTRDTERCCSLWDCDSRSGVSACCVNGEERTEHIWRPIGFSFLNYRQSSVLVCFGRHTRLNWTWCDRSASTIRTPECASQSQRWTILCKTHCWITHWMHNDRSYLASQFQQHSGMFGNTNISLASLDILRRLTFGDQVDVLPEF